MKSEKPLARLANSTFFLLVLVLCVIAAGCGESGELSRSAAEKSISESNDFKTPFQIEYTQGNVKYNEGLLEVISEDETKEQATARRIARYLELNPQIAVLDHFGMVVPQVIPREEKAPKRVYYSNPAFWSFSEKYTGSEKARKYWQELGLPPVETAFPLAERKFIEVTGITKQGESQAVVEFKWEWHPNEIGKALGGSTKEFKLLPVDLQKLLTGEKIPAGEIQSRNWQIDWRVEKHGQAFFQKYDDGWRLVRIFNL